MVRHRTEAFSKGEELYFGFRHRTKLLAKVKRHNPEPEPADKFNLSELTENETLRGRWYTERSDEAFSERDSHKWSSWGNRRSFWIQREYLLQAIHDISFDLLMEQFDSIGPNIAENMLCGYYRAEREEVYCIKTGKRAKSVILLPLSPPPPSPPRAPSRTHPPPQRKYIPILLHPTSTSHLLAPPYTRPPLALFPLLSITSSRFASRTCSTLASASRSIAAWLKHGMTIETLPLPTEVVIVCRLSGEQSAPPA